MHVIKVAHTVNRVKGVAGKPRGQLPYIEVNSDATAVMDSLVEALLCCCAN